MSKYGLGRGLSSLFTAYEPEEKEVKKAPKKAEKEPLKTTVTKTKTKEESDDEILERAMNLIKESSTYKEVSEPIIAKEETPYLSPLEERDEFVERDGYLKERSNLQSKLDKLEQDLSKNLDAYKDKIVEMSLTKIEPNQNQPRKNFDRESLEELSQSIKQHGVIQPIIVVPKGDKFVIVAGERRYKACILAGLKTIPVVIKGYTAKEVKEIALIENLQREDLNPVETGFALKQLIENYHLSQEEVAEKLGKSRSVITNYLRILRLEPEVLAMVERGKLSFAHAKSIVSISDRSLQIKLAKKASDDKLSSREVENMVAAILNPEKVKKQKEEIGLEIRNLVNSMQYIFGTKVSVMGSDRRGRIYIDYFNQDDLDRIAGLIMKLR